MCARHDVKETKTMTRLIKQSELKGLVKKSREEEQVMQRCALIENIVAHQNLENVKDL